MTVRVVLKPYLVVLVDVMPNVADGICTVVHNVLHVFFYIYEWQVKQPLWQILGHLVIKK